MISHFSCNPPVDLRTNASIWCIARYQKATYLYLHHLILRSVLLELVNASTSNLVHATQSDTMLWRNTRPSYATWCENMLLVGIQYHHPVSSWCPEGKNSQAGILSSNIYRALWHCLYTESSNWLLEFTMHSRFARRASFASDLATSRLKSQACTLIR